MNKQLETLANEPRRCWICGCTDQHACPDGCYWIDQDLCSACIDPQKNAPLPKRHPEIAA